MPAKFVDAFTAGLRRRRLRTWFGLTAIAFIAAEMAAASDGSVGMAAGAMRGTALLFALGGASGELQRAYRERDQEQRRAQERVEAARAAAQAERAAREEAAHDARSALATIEIAAAALAEDEEVSSAITSEVALLRSLLSSPTVGIPDLFTLDDLVTATAAAQRLKGVPVAVAVPPGLTAYGDAEATHRALQNLLENARRHAPGSVVDVTGWTDGGFTVLRVSDRGPGIPHEFRRSIFDRGVRVGTGGSGLGLSIAAALVEAQGGAIKLEPRPGGGASFLMHLPARPVAAAT